MEFDGRVTNTEKGWRLWTWKARWTFPTPLGRAPGLHAKLALLCNQTHPIIHYVVAQSMCPSTPGHCCKSGDTIVFFTAHHIFCFLRCGLVDTASHRGFALHSPYRVFPLVIMPALRGCVIRRLHSASFQRLFTLEIEKLARFHP